MRLLLVRTHTLPVSIRFMTRATPVRSRSESSNGSAWPWRLAFVRTSRMISSTAVLNS